MARELINVTRLVPDELDAADDPDGIDLAAREAEAKILRARLAFE